MSSVPWHALRHWLSPHRTAGHSCWRRCMTSAITDTWPTSCCPLTRPMVLSTSAPATRCWRHRPAPVGCATPSLRWAWVCWPYWSRLAGRFGQHWGGRWTKSMRTSPNWDWGNSPPRLRCHRHCTPAYLGGWPRRRTTWPGSIWHANRNTRHAWQPSTNPRHCSTRSTCIPSYRLQTPKARSRLPTRNSARSAASVSRNWLAKTIALSIQATTRTTFGKPCGRRYPVATSGAARSATEPRTAPSIGSTR